MDPMQSDLPQSLSLLPKSNTLFLARNIKTVVAFQLLFCVTSSICLTLYFYRKYYCDGDKSWKKAVGMMGPIRNRLKNLEKEKMIWNSYLEWIEDYCGVYYSLLNYLNSTIADLDIIQAEGFGTRNVNFSEYSSVTEFGSVKGAESRLISSSEEDLQPVSNIDRVVSKLQSLRSELASGDVKVEEAETKPQYQSPEKGLSEKTEVAEGRREIVEKKEKLEDDTKLTEDQLETLFLEKKNAGSDYRSIYPINDTDVIEL